MTENLETVAVVTVKTVIGTNPGKTSFILYDAVYFVVRQTIAGVDIPEIQGGILRLTELEGKQ